MKKIIWWTIKVQWAEEDNNPTKEQYLDDIPDWVAGNVDEFLNELEQEAI